MIKEIRIDQWKSFDQATLYVDPLSILIGANASGKSNLIEALLFLQRIGSGVAVDQAIRGNDLLPPVRGGADWVCRRPGDSFGLEVLIGAGERRDLRYRIRIRTDRVSAGVTDEDLTAFDHGPDGALPAERRLIWRLPGGGYAIDAGSDRPPTQIIGHDVRLSILSSADWRGDDAGQVASQLSQVFVFDPVPARMRDYSPLSDRLKADGSNLAGVLAALEPPWRSQVEDTLTRYLRTLPERDLRRVWTERVGRLDSDAMLYCEEGWEGAASSEIDARGMSDGTLRYLAIVAALLIRPPGSLLVIEDVDNGLHPSRAGLLIELLRTLGRERGIDVLVTTHNPALLDAAGVRMLPFITVAYRDPATGASRLTQLEDLTQLPKLMAAGSLGQLAAGGLIESALAMDGT